VAAAGRRRGHRDRELLKAWVDAIGPPIFRRPIKYGKQRLPIAWPLIDGIRPAPAPDYAPSVPAQGTPSRSEVPRHASARIRRMERTHSDINLVLPGILGSGGDEIAIATIREELAPLGLSVGDTGLQVELASAEPPLRFILDLVQNPLVAGVIAAKVYDAVLGEAVKVVLGKLVGAGKDGVTALYRALSERFPGRQIQIAFLRRLSS
jgi:hypothetical protein